ncbi:MAG: hypothetical protein IKZ88_05515 [Neisseriaceae bacterium]|nr:hypothetical protein [Neisseriaceae bacterium]
MTGVFFRLTERKNQRLSVLLVGWEAHPITTPCGVSGGSKTHPTITHRSLTYSLT